MIYIRIQSERINAVSITPFIQTQNYTYITHDGEINKYSTYENGQVVTPTQAEIDIIEAEAEAQLEAKNKADYIIRICKYKYSVEYVLMNSTTEEIQEYREYALLAKTNYENDNAENYEKTVIIDIITLYNLDNPENAIEFTGEETLEELRELYYQTNYPL